MPSQNLRMTSWVNFYSFIKAYTRTFRYWKRKAKICRQNKPTEIKGLRSTPLPAPYALTSIAPSVSDSTSAAVVAAASSVHQLPRPSILSPPNRAACCGSQQHLHFFTPAAVTVISLSPKGLPPESQDKTESLQFSHSLCKGAGCKLFNMLMSSVKHNPQTSGASLHWCPSKTQSLTNSNQYFNYRIKLAPFCFTSNPNCFLSTRRPARGSDLNTICHCRSTPSQLTCLSRELPQPG